MAVGALQWVLHNGFAVELCSGGALVVELCNGGFAMVLRWNFAVGALRNFGGGALLGWVLLDFSARRRTDGFFILVQELLVIFSRWSIQGGDDSPHPHRPTKTGWVECENVPANL